VCGFLAQDILELVVDGQRVRGYRSPDSRAIWIRDHSDIMRAGVYLEPDAKSCVQLFVDTQAANGRVHDYVTTHPEHPSKESANWTKYVRVPVEADVEYRLAKAAFLAWQATGDDEWLEELRPSIAKALEYPRGHAWRWDAGLGLVKRPYTIDTWDFAYTGGAYEGLQFQITDDTYWGIMHGDNSGYYEAYRNFATLLEHLGSHEESRRWRERAEAMREAMNRTCFNGRFYTHFVKLTPVSIDGVDEGSQLSLSNPLAVTRGAADLGMARSILAEYRSRGERSGAFREWFSMDPPFPDGIFGDERLVAGAYVNGGIMPLVGGELALAGLESGYEEYGVETLRRYAELTECGETYLWYFPDGRASTVEESTSPEATPTDGWGSSAMLHALIRGLAGVRDRGAVFRRVTLSPRWSAAGVSEAEVELTYAATGASLRYAYSEHDGGIRIEMQSSHDEIQVHLLLPPQQEVTGVSIGGREVGWCVTGVADSRYVDFGTPAPAGPVIEVRFG
jgi:hypothetical protein